MTKEDEKTITIRVPNNEFPYNNCVVEDGDPGDLTQKLTFTTISKAGTKRRITIHPNGVVTESII